MQTYLTQQVKEHFLFTYKNFIQIKANWLNPHTISILLYVTSFPKGISLIKQQFIESTVAQFTQEADKFDRSLIDKLLGLLFLRKYEKKFIL